MNLLLLLSAFLTALTGAITGVRPVQAAAAQEQVVGRGVVRAVKAAALASRPVQGWGALVRVPAVAERAFAPFAALPVFGLRRRE